MNDVHELYNVALHSFTEKLRQDERIIASFVGGSLSYDVVWEKSDIDMVIVSDDETRPHTMLHLVENDICISANVMSRQKFKQQCEKMLQSSFFHSFMAKCTSLFCKDAAIQDLYDRFRHVGERDLDVQLMIDASIAITILEKAEKWIVVKQDATYCFLWLLKAIEQMARIEVMLNQDIPTREVVQQALKYNPEFFRRIYNDLIQGPKTLEVMNEAVQLADAYLEARYKRLFKLVIDYLAEEKDVRTFSELMQHMKQRFQMADALIVHGCEWLAQKGYIERASTPKRITTRSRIEVDELAYFYGEGFLG